MLGVPGAHRREVGVVMKGPPRVLVLGLFSIMTGGHTKLPVSQSECESIAGVVTCVTISVLLVIYCTIISENRAVGGNWVKGNGSLISVIIVNLQLSQNKFNRKMKSRCYSRNCRSAGYVESGVCSISTE